MLFWTFSSKGNQEAIAPQQVSQGQDYQAERETAQNLPTK